MEAPRSEMLLLLVVLEALWAASPSPPSPPTAALGCVSRLGSDDAFSGGTTEGRCIRLFMVDHNRPLQGGNTFETHIIGGREAVPHSRPYMVSLQKSGRHQCGGVLLCQNWVLTAAHCLTQPMQQLRLVLGLHVLGDPSLTCRIRKVVLHPEYKPAPHLENDLALLKLDGKVKPSKTIQPLALPRGRQAVATGTWCSLAGWGLTHQPGNPARALQELDLRVLDTRMCNNSRFWHGDISSHMICLAADSKSQAPCKGDSGGPVVCRRGQVAGILSFSSKNCTNIFKPPVAVAVAPYMPWIKNTLRHNSSPPSP